MVLRGYLRAWWISHHNGFPMDFPMDFVYFLQGGAPTVISWFINHGKYIYIIICMYEGLWGITLYEFPMISLLYHHIFIWPRLPEVELHFLGGSQLLTLLLSLGASSAIAWGGDPERRGVKDDPQGIGWWLHGDFMGVHGKQLLGKPGDKSSRLVNCP
jgi:hypothetical protein